MKYNLTQEQFLTYIYGSKKAQKIQENPDGNHYVKAFEKLQKGKKFVWNWAAFFAFNAWCVYRRMPLIAALGMLYVLLTSALIFTVLISIALITGTEESLVDIERIMHIIVLAIVVPAYIIFGGFSDYFLVKHASKQVTKGNIYPFPNGGNLILAILSGLFPLFIFIAIFYNKYKISQYRKAKNLSFS